MSGPNTTSVLCCPQHRIRNKKVNDIFFAAVKMSDGHHTLKRVIILRASKADVGSRLEERRSCQQGQDWSTKPKVRQYIQMMMMLWPNDRDEIVLENDY